MDVLGGFELMESIGRGASARVWRARRLADGALFAVKVLHDDLGADAAIRERFAAEGAMLTGRRVPGVVSVHEVVVDGDRLGLVMDLVEGVDLRQSLTNGGPLPVGEAWALLSQVAGGLAGAHAAGVIHRDVKPENILVADHDEEVGGRAAWITDFGVARLVYGASRTRSSQIPGTVDYVAPEVISGVPPTAAVDVYALGVVLYEAVMGWRPFRGEHVAAIIDQHLHACPDRPQQFPRELWTLVERCLSKDPDE